MMNWLRNFLRIFPSLFLVVLAALLFSGCHTFDGGEALEGEVPAGGEAEGRRPKAEGARTGRPAGGEGGGYERPVKAESQQGGRGDPPPTAPSAEPVPIPEPVEVIKMVSKQAIQPPAESPQGGPESADFILPAVPEQIDPPSPHSVKLSMMLLKGKEKELEMIDPEEVELPAAPSVLERGVKEGPAAILKVSETGQNVEKPLDKVRDKIREVSEAREMWARRGDQVEISFGNRGWVFLGLRGSRELKGLIFMGSKDLGGKVIFHFRCEDYGVYLLEFQLQDNRTATVKNESVRLSVVNLEEFDSRLASAAIEMSDKGEGERFLLAEKLYGLGQYEAALREYISGYREGVPLVNDRIASIYLQSGEHQAAAKFYEKNRSSEGELGEKAVIGLVKSYLALEDSIKLLGLLDKFLGLEYLSIEEDLMHLIHYEIEHGEPALTYELLTEYVSGFPGGVFLDEVYFLFGQLFEGESPYRDLERSREYYLRVYEEFPISDFSEEAGERVKYLERYFFYIR